MLGKLRVMKWLIQSFCLFLMGTAEAGLNESKDYKMAQAAQAAGDFARAYSLYREIAEDGNNPLVYFSLGLFHRNGWGREENQAAACDWFELAALHGGVPYAQHLYAECLEQGIGRQAEPSAAAHWYQQANEGGYLLSSCSLGQLYMTGKGVRKDPLKALKLCHGAVKGSTVAMVWMGRFYLEGDEEIRDPKLAFRWFEQAARNDLPEAYYYLARMISLGLVDGLTTRHARQMYEKAASMRYMPAYYPTARLYFHAPPEPQTGYLSAHDLAKAYLWLSATKKLSRNSEELTETTKMLDQVLTVMPESWAPELDEKLHDHLQAQGR